MSMEKEIPSGGFRLLDQYCLEATYKIEEEREGLASDGRPLEFNWDWRLLSPDTFEILLGVRVGPSKDAPESIIYVLVSKFGASGETSVDVETFARLHGPTAIVPYLREGISAMSARGPFGTYFIPSVNVQELAEDFPLESASGGVQLRENEDAWTIPVSTPGG